MLQQIDTFDLRVDMCMTSKLLPQPQTLEIGYLFLLTPSLPQSTDATETLRLRLSIKRATLPEQTIHFASGDPPVLLDMIYIANNPESEQKPNVLALVLHRNTVQKCLKLHLRARYQLDREGITLKPPSLAPLSGSLLSEKVVVKNPRRPLAMEASISLESISGIISTQSGCDLVFERRKILPPTSSSLFIDGLSLYFKVPPTMLEELDEHTTNQEAITHIEDTSFTLDKKFLMPEDTFIMSDIKRQSSMTSDEACKISSVPSPTQDEPALDAWLINASPHGKQFSVIAFAKNQLTSY